jgi:broad specificity phosphatase PhoE
MIAQAMVPQAMVPQAMVPLALIRHGPTEWSEARRYQGRADTPLSAAGRAAVSAWRIPKPFRAFDWFCSPLARAVETANILGLPAPAVEPRLIEMDWGDFQGLTYEELKARYVRPPSGESPREVIERVKPWLAERIGAGRPAGAVVHRGIIRALLAHATGWPMVGRPPYKLDWSALHLFELLADGEIRVVRLNMAMTGECV